MMKLNIVLYSTIYLYDLSCNVMRVRVCCVMCIMIFLFYDTRYFSVQNMRKNIILTDEMLEKGF